MHAYTENMHVLAPGRVEEDLAAAVVQVCVIVVS
jgi:hypothetical protein